MTLLITRTTLIAFLVAGLPFLSQGNGLRIASQDGFASARAEAFVATADNPSAIYYNPAGITQLEGLHIRGGVYGLYLDPTYRPVDTAPNSGNTYHLDNTLAAAPNFFACYSPSPGRLSYGLGIYAPFGGRVSWPEVAGFRAVALESSLKYITISPVIALRLSPEFSIGSGLTVNYGNLGLTQGLKRFANPALPDFFHFAGEGWSVGYQLGLLWQPHQSLALGINFRSSTSVSFNGHTEFERLAQIPSTRLAAEAEFDFPLTAVVGVSYRPTSRWNLEFDADYTDWSGFATTIRQSTPANGWPAYLNQWPQNIPVTLNWQASWMYEFGVTHYLDDGWRISTGYVFNENSVPDKFYLPTTIDLNRHFLSIGLGHDGKRISFDVAYQFGIGQERTVTGSIPPSQPVPTVNGLADGNYTFISHALLISVGLHF